MAKAFVKFQVPKDLNDKVLQLVETVKSTGKLRRGINETAKSVEHGSAKMVVIAEDIEPEEIAMHLPILCEEKKIHYIYVQSKLELGRASGIDVQSAAIALLDIGEGKDLFSEIVSMIEKLKKSPAG